MEPPYRTPAERFYTAAFEPCGHAPRGHPPKSIRPNAVIFGACDHDLAPPLNIVKATKSVLAKKKREEEGEYTASVWKGSCKKCLSGPGNGGSGLSHRGG